MSIIRPHTSELDFTIAMSTFNRSKWAVEALQSLESVKIPPNLKWEALVVDNACTDNTWESLEKYQKSSSLPIRIIKEEQVGLSRARNRIINEAKGEIISLYDDDERFDQDFIYALVNAFSNPEVDMVCGRINLLYESGRPKWMQDEWEGFLSRVDAGDSAFKVDSDGFVYSGGNLAFVRNKVNDWEYFDVNLSRQGKKVIGGGDVKFCKAAFHAGAHILYDPAVVLYHLIPPHRSTKHHLRTLRFRAGEGYGRIEKRDFTRTLFGIPFFAFIQLITLNIKYLNLLLIKRSEHAFRQHLNVIFHIGWMYGLWRKYRGDKLAISK